MTRYEETLGKIAPVFYKFVNYRKYFYNNREYIAEYLIKANMHVFYGIEIEDTYLEYYFSDSRDTYVASKFSPFKKTEYAIVDLHRFDWRGDVGFEGYTNGFINFITTIILNKFELLGLKYLFDVKKTRFTYYDLFIILVGKDTAETIISNIK